MNMRRVKLQRGKGKGERVGKRGKRGDTSITIIRAAGLAVAAFVILMMLTYWRDVKDDTFLEKNYMARDLALLITAAQAAPGNLMYCYYNVASFDFEYEIGNSEVKVSDVGDKDGGGGQARYLYAEKVGNPLKIVGEQPIKSPAVIIVIKDGEGVSIVPKGRGEDASPCTA